MPFLPSNQQRQSTEGIQYVISMAVNLCRQREADDLGAGGGNSLVRSQVERGRRARRPRTSAPLALPLPLRQHRARQRARHEVDEHHPRPPCQPAGRHRTVGIALKRSISLVFLVCSIFICVIECAPSDCFLLNVLGQLQCFDAVGWAAGMADKETH